MLALHPNILEKNGIKEFAILPFNEFKKIKTELQDFEDLKDLKDLKKAKLAEKNIVGFSLSEAKQEWNIQA